MIDPAMPVLDAPDNPAGSWPALALAQAARAVEAVPTEHQWRRPPQSEAAPPSRHHGLLVSRWLWDGSAPLDVTHPGDTQRHCIALALRSSSIRLLRGGKPIIDGRLPAGAVQVTAPSTPTSAVFDSASDVLHLHVPQSAMAECHADLFGHAPAGDVILDDPFPYVDPVLERLGQALVAAHFTTVFKRFVGDTPHCWRDKVASTSWSSHA